MRSHEVDIPEPCTADWDAMRPEQRGRFCFECQKKVHDLSAMTEKEAERFLRRAEDGDVCVSYLERADGVIVFRPAPVVPASRLRRLVPAAGLAMAVAACTPIERPDVKPERPVAAEKQVAEPEPTALAERSLLAHPTDALPVPPSKVEVDTDIPCDGGISEPPPPEVASHPPPPRITRTAGKPVLRKGGLRRPPAIK